MLGKLLKHEFKHSARYVTAIYACTAAVLLVMLFALLVKITWLSVAASMILYFAGILVVVMTLVSVIKNFYDTLYTNQGYLSFTLPVKCSSLLVSKVIVSFIWIILSFAALALIYFVIFLNAKAQTDGKMGDIVEMLRESGILDMLPSGAMIAKFIVLVVVLALLTILTFVGFVYFSVTLANTRPLQKHPKIFGFLIFFGSYAVSNSIGAKLTYSLPLSFSVTNEGLKLAFSSMENSESVFSFGIGGTVFMALVALAMLSKTDENCHKAIEQLPNLRGCQVHTTVMLSEVDRKIFKKLGVVLTCEPVSKKQKPLIG